MKKIVASLLVACAFSVQAEESMPSMPADTSQDSPFNLMFVFGITFGGEELASTTNGSELKSGGLLYCWHCL